MSIQEKALLVGFVIGMALAIYVTRRSLREEKVYGGALAQFFHFLGALGFCMTLPTVLTTIILHGGFGIAFPLGMGLVVISLIMLVIFAVIEQPARAKITPEEEVWTEEKARASGM
jgi:ABC-type sulfate transport system permease component